MYHFVASTRGGLHALTLSAILFASSTANADESAPLAVAANASPRADELVQRARGRGWDREAIDRGLQLADEAARSGLPADAVADKLLEGIAKGVPPERIFPVVETLIAQLREADRALAAAAPAGHRHALVEQGAEALRAGVPAEALRALASEAGGAEPARLSVAMRELTRLPAEDRHGDFARLLGAMVVRGYPNAAIGSLSERWREALAEGAPRDVLLDELAARTSAGRPLDRLVDPFSETPGIVIRDPAADAHRGERGKSSQAPGIRKKGGHPGATGLDRRGAAGSLNPGLERAQKRRNEKGKPDVPPGQSQRPPKVKPQGPTRPPQAGGPNR